MKENLIERNSEKIKVEYNEDLAPEYFLPTEGRRVARDFVAKFSEWINIRNFGSRMNRGWKIESIEKDLGKILGSWTNYFFPGSFQSDSFVDLMKSGSVESVKIGLCEPNFDKYYWSQTHREKCASLSMFFFNKEDCMAVRIVLVSNDGAIIKIKDFGLTDSHRLLDKLRYAELEVALRQYINKMERVIPKE